MTLFVARFFAVAMIAGALSACGGGGGGGGSESSDSLDSFIELQGRNEGEYTLQSLFIDSDVNSRDVDIVCDTIEAPSRAEIEPLISSMDDDGFCVEDDSLCVHTTDNAITIKELFSRENVAYPRNGLLAEVVYLPAFSGQGSIEVYAGSRGASCDVGGSVVIPTLQGSYTGRLYTPNRTQTLDRQVLTISPAFNVVCTAGICDAAGTIDDLSGMNLNPTAGTGGPYLSSAFIAAGPGTSSQQYNFFGTATADGDLVVGIGFPIGANGTGTQCYDNCVMLVYTRN